MSDTKLNTTALMAKEKIAKMTADSMTRSDKAIARKAKEVSKQPYSHERRFLNSVHAKDIAIKKLNNQRKYELKQEIKFCTDVAKKAKLEADLASLE